MDLSKKKKNQSKTKVLLLFASHYGSQTNCRRIVSNPRRHRQTLEDAASTSRTSPLPPSGRLGRRCPRCTERTPAQKSFNVSFCLNRASLRCTEREVKIKQTQTCLVFAFPKFLMYMSYSFTGGRSKTENVVEKSSSISRSSSTLRFLEPQQNSLPPNRVPCSSLE